MSDKLKKFITENKEAFDSHEPSKEIWKKIGKDMKGENTGWIRSRRFSKYLYFGFGLSAIILGIYFMNNSKSNEAPVENKTTPNYLTQEKTNVNSSDPNQNSSIAANTSDKTVIKYPPSEQGIANNEIDTASTMDQNAGIAHAENEVEANEIVKTNAAEKQMTPGEKKRNDLIRSRKNKDLYLPEDPEKFNSYVGTIYEGTSFCSLLSAFKLYGDVQIDHGKWHQDGHQDKVTIRAVSCSYLANFPDMKAVWVKGKTDQKLKFSISKGFKNIVLIKSDGSRSLPRAVSHYYPGLGAIGEFQGKFFNMVFTDKVELILFFRNVEQGDKIMIDDKIEVLVKSQPK
jgi:hypothetical protein